MPTESHVVVVTAIIMKYINESQQSELDYTQVKNKAITDFAIDSLEIFEMLLAIEEAVEIKIPDSIISGEKKIFELIEEIVKLA